jgi:tRNA1(Val) A37 N6-methylase TrmN6
MPVIIEPMQIARIQNDVSSLVGADNRIKKLVFDSFSNGHEPEHIGSFFENSLLEEERKDRGQYYTPKSIVEYMIAQLDIKKDSKIVDPSCGCGSFLLTVFDIFQKKYGANFLNNVYGVDANKKATKITRACLYMKAGYREDYIDVVTSNIKVGNSIVQDRNIDKLAFDWRKEFYNVFQDGGFDFVIGNPPYITLQKDSGFDSTESIYPAIIDGPINAATLMIGRSLEILKPGGTLAFLLPKSVLFVDSYNKLRQYLLANTRLVQVFDIGAKFKDVRGEQVILVVKKSPALKDDKIKICVFSGNSKALSDQPSLRVSQKELSATNRFLTLEKHSYYSLIEKISSVGINLDQFVHGQIFRGLPVGGNQLVDPKAGEGELAIRGKNISKFNIKTCLALSNAMIEKQSPAKIKNLRQKKIVLQNIFSSEAGVIAGYDNRGTLSLDTVTNIIVDDESRGKYVLALLNSKLINFYLMCGVFDCSRLTMHLDKSYIGLIPIIGNPDARKLQLLIKIADSLVNCEDVGVLKSKNREIDNLVYTIYSLNNDEIILIEAAMEKLLSRKSLW